MKFFLDTEFVDDGLTIDPISIGVVAEGGEEFYIELYFNTERAEHHPFVSKHVLPHLTWKMLDRLMSRDAGYRLLDWVESVAKNEPIEFWGYYVSYDWVLIAQLFGPMAHLPEVFPKLCLDLQQHWLMLGRPDVKPPQPLNEHHALADAKWNKAFYEAMNR
jgi:hypothetical protein